MKGCRVAMAGDSESGTISPVSPANQPCGGFEEASWER